MSLTYKGHSLPDKLIVKTPDGVELEVKVNSIQIDGGDTQAKVSFAGSHGSSGVSGTATVPFADLVDGGHIIPDSLAKEWTVPEPLVFDASDSFTLKWDNSGLLNNGVPVFASHHATADLSQIEADLKALPLIPEPDPPFANYELTAGAYASSAAALANSFSTSMLAANSVSFEQALADECKKLAYGLTNAMGYHDPPPNTYGINFMAPSFNGKQAKIKISVEITE